MRIITQASLHFYDTDGVSPKELLSDEYHQGNRLVGHRPLFFRAGQKRESSMMNIRKKGDGKRLEQYYQARYLYRARYTEATLSRKPRSELISAFLAIPVAIALFYCALARWGRDIPGELGWLFISFLVVFIWHTRHAFIAMPFLANEAVLVASRRLGYPIMPFARSRWLDRMVGQLTMILLA